MRRNVLWLVVVPVMILPALLFAVSCTKKVVQSEPVMTTQPVQTTQPEVPDPSDTPTGESGQPAVMQEDQPRMEEAARKAAEAAFVNEKIHFSFDSHVLSEQARKILKGKAEYLRHNPDVGVTVEGHCDERGTNAYNIALGQRRAESAKKFLVDLGISGNRLETISFGEERPIATGHNETSWVYNRRAQFVIN